LVGGEREDKKKRVGYKITINILRQCVPFIREDEQVIGKKLVRMDKREERRDAHFPS
jgi:hypothetical protein